MEFKAVVEDLDKMRRRTYVWSINIDKQDVNFLFQRCILEERNEKQPKYKRTEAVYPDEAIPEEAWTSLECQAKAHVLGLVKSSILRHTLKKNKEASAEEIKKRCDKYEEQLEFCRKRHQERRATETP